MPDWHHDDGLRWRPLAPFGAEIDHDLSQPMPAPTRDRFVALFRDHGLIVAHGQSLTMDQQRALLGLLGPILTREGESGYLSNASGPASSSELRYHADAAYTEDPFAALALHAVDLVDGASSTRFVHAERALETLPADLRTRLAAHPAEMITPAMETLALRSCDVREHHPIHRELLPSIRRNPRTGRDYIAVSEMHGARLDGMDWEESRALLGAVFDHLYAPASVHEHVWHMGDLVLWDNIACQHARGSIASAGRRILQRVIVGTTAVAAPHVRAA